MLAYCVSERKKKEQQELMKHVMEERERQMRTKEAMKEEEKAVETAQLQALTRDQREAVSGGKEKCIQSTP